MRLFFVNYCLKVMYFFIPMLFFYGCANNLNPVNSVQELTIISPTENEILSFPVWVRHNISNDESIFKVDYYIDDEHVEEITLAPFYYYWDVSKWADEKFHTIKSIITTTDKEIIHTDRVKVFIPINASQGPVLVHPSKDLEILDLSDLFLEWSKIPNISAYHFQVSTQKNFSIIISEKILNKNKANLSLLPFGEFYFRIRVKDLNYKWNDWGKVSKFSYSFYNGDFEAGNFIGWILAGEDENSIKIVNNPVFEGVNAAKITLKYGDDVQGPRAEITKLDDSVLGKERIYSWSFMIPENYIEDDRWQMINQFHDYPNFLVGETWSNYPVKPPPIHINYHESECNLILRTTTLNHAEDTVATFSIKKGEWFTIRYQIKWSLEDDGYVLLIVNGNPVTPFNGIDHKYFAPTVFNEVGNFLKMGLYRQTDIQSTNTVFVDNVYIGPHVE